MQTIGERLEEARKKKGISIREAAEATKIRGDYLSKFESNHFDIGLTEIYTRGFLRTYANFLKVPADRLLNDYSALGRGEARPRQPSREVYGRMDISVSTAGETSDRAAPPSDEAPPAEPSRTQPRYPRGGSSLPSGPDPALIFKYVKWAGIAVGAIVLLFFIKSFFGGGDSSAANSRNVSPATQTPAGPTLTLTAINSVYVKVMRKNADTSDGEVLWEGTLNKNERQVIRRPAFDLYVIANPNENLDMEADGKRLNMKQLGTGMRKGQLPAPTNP